MILTKKQNMVFKNAQLKGYLCCTTPRLKKKKLPYLKMAYFKYCKDKKFPYIVLDRSGRYITVTIDLSTICKNKGEIGESYQQFQHVIDRFKKNIKPKSFIYRDGLLLGLQKIKPKYALTFAEDLARVVSQMKIRLSQEI